MRGNIANRLQATHAQVRRSVALSAGALLLGVLGAVCTNVEILTDVSSPYYRVPVSGTLQLTADGPPPGGT